MGSPIIIDDGGSTRIRYLPDSGSDAMDGLLNPPPPDDSAHFHHADGNFRVLQIACVQGSGVAMNVDPIPLNQEDVFHIDCGNGQTAVVTIDHKMDCRIKLRGSAHQPPMVQARQYSGKRCYMVLNAIKIASVDLTRGSSTIRVYTSPADSVHSSLVFDQVP